MYAVFTVELVRESYFMPFLLAAIVIVFIGLILLVFSKKKLRGLNGSGGAAQGEKKQGSFVGTLIGVIALMVVAVILLWLFTTGMELLEDFSLP